MSIVGTQITDFLTDIRGVSPYASTVVFTVALAVVFTVWWRQERLGGTPHHRYDRAARGMSVHP